MELVSWLCGVGLAGWSVGGACGACGGWGWVEQEAAERCTCGPSPCVVLLQHQSNPTPADENESIDHSSEPTAIDRAACSRAQARPRSVASMRLRTPPHQSKCNLNDRVRRRVAAVLGFREGQPGFGGPSCSRGTGTLEVREERFFLMTGPVGRSIPGLSAFSARHSIHSLHRITDPNPFNFSRTRRYARPISLACL